MFNIEKFYIMLALKCVFCIYLRANSDLCHLQHKLIVFYNPDEKCLQRGTDWVFKYSGLGLVCKGLKCDTNSINTFIYVMVFYGIVVSFKPL